MKLKFCILGYLLERQLSPRQAVRELSKTRSPEFIRGKISQFWAKTLNKLRAPGSTQTKMFVFGQPAKSFSCKRRRLKPAIPNNSPLVRRFSGALSCLVFLSLFFLISNLASADTPSQFFVFEETFFKSKDIAVSLWNSLDIAAKVSISIIPTSGEYYNIKVSIDPYIYALEPKTCTLFGCSVPKNDVNDTGFIKLHFIANITLPNGSNYKTEGDFPKDSYSDLLGQREGGGITWDLSGLGTFNKPYGNANLTVTLKYKYCWWTVLGNRCDITDTTKTFNFTIENPFVANENYGYLVHSGVIEGKADVTDFHVKHFLGTLKLYHKKTDKTSYKTNLPTGFKDYSYTLDDDITYIMVWESVKKAENNGYGTASGFGPDKLVWGAFSLGDKETEGYNQPSQIQPGETHRIVSFGPFPVRNLYSIASPQNSGSAQKKEWRLKLWLAGDYIESGKSTSTTIEASLGFEAFGISGGILGSYTQESSYLKVHTSFMPFKSAYFPFSANVYAPMRKIHLATDLPSSLASKSGLTIDAKTLNTNDYETYKTEASNLTVSIAEKVESITTSEKGNYKFDKWQKCEFEGSCTTNKNLNYSFPITQKDIELEAQYNAFEDSHYKLTINWQPSSVSEIGNALVDCSGNKIVSSGDKTRKELWINTSNNACIAVVDKEIIAGDKTYIFQYWKLDGARQRLTSQRLANSSALSLRVSEPTPRAKRRGGNLIRYQADLTSEVYMNSPHTLTAYFDEIKQDTTPPTLNITFPCTSGDDDFVCYSEIYIKGTTNDPTKEGDSTSGIKRVDIYRVDEKGEETNIGKIEKNLSDFSQMAECPEKKQKFKLTAVDNANNSTTESTGYTCWILNATAMPEDSYKFSLPQLSIPQGGMITLPISATPLKENILLKNMELLINFDSQRLILKSVGSTDISKSYNFKVEYPAKNLVKIKLSVSTDQGFSANGDIAKLLFSAPVNSSAASPILFQHIYLEDLQNTELGFASASGEISIIPREIKKGDVNIDGTINLKDVLKMLQTIQYIKTLDTEGENYAADIDENGIIEKEDVVQILKKVLGLL